ncbi:DUF732 domain-containing protein [Mycolicibacterium boenickei]
MPVVMRALGCATVTVALAITGALANAPLAMAGPAEDYFLNELYKTHQKWFWPFGEDYIIGVAHGVCDAWDSGVGYPEKVESMAIEKGWTHRNTRYFVALSTATFCPDRYIAQIPAEARLPDGK